MLHFLAFYLWRELKVTHLSQCPSISLIPLVIYYRSLCYSPWFLLFPLMLQNVWGFWRRSKLVIIIKHFCVPLYLNQKRGSMWYCWIWPNATIENILKDCFYANQYVSGPRKGWKSVRARRSFKSRLTGNGGWRGARFSCHLNVTRQTSQLPE